MRRCYKFSFSLTLLTTVLATFAFSQSKPQKEALKKREQVRRAIHTRDSLMRTLSKSDTSINSLLQRVEQYTTSFDQIDNSLDDGIDTVEVGQQIPEIIRRLDKINSAAKTHKSSNLRYLFVLRDNLDHIQTTLDKWQSDMEDVSEKLVQNENDLLKFSKDTVLKTVPYDSAVRKTFFTQLKQVKVMWGHIDSANRGDLLKVNLLQDKLAVSYTKTLDESDQIDTKITGFAKKAIAGESAYIWATKPQFEDFRSALGSTIRLNKFLLTYFFKSDTETHAISVVFLILMSVWILYNRDRAMRKKESAEIIPKEAPYIFKRPLLSTLQVVTAIVPYFYDHPPTASIEILFLVSVSLSLVLIKGDVPAVAYRFFKWSALLAFVYAISNLFIEISNIDRYLVLLFSIVSISIGYSFYKEVKASPAEHFPWAKMALRIFIFMQLLSLLLNITGRFSLAKILGVTAVFNLWLLLVLYVTIQVITEALFLNFEAKKGGNSIINWLDYDLVKQKTRKTLMVAAGLLWLFSLLQNLNIDDWVKDYVEDFFNQAHSVGGATFTLGGFVIFIFVIWLSSIASRIISYFYDVSAQRVTDLSVAKRKNRTSTIIIRIAVFSVGFLLAVGASDFPLDKLTIIISAFGVGIGFGLQNIVNNLVSGLILAFEKPINIGDVIEVDGHQGTMKEIGIRSSKVVTGDGSEVIIPNGDFISHQVVNWTLSNSNRQIDVRVITAYGVDVNTVRELLKNLLKKRTDIMDNPGPAIFINNVSENAVEFKVLFWVADISQTGELRSQVLTDIYQLLGKEGVQLPSTQKDVYVHFPEGVPLPLPEGAGENKKEKKTTKEKPKDQDQ
jgi:potassium efflux system protein